MSLHNCLKSRVLEDPWKDNITNLLKHCYNLGESLFTRFINHCERNCLGKVRFRSIQNRKTVNALTPDDKDDLLNRDNLTQPIQRELSEKQKIFLTFFWIFKIFFTFWKFLWKNEPHSLRVSEIKGSKKHC